MPGMDPSQSLLDLQQICDTAGAVLQRKAVKLAPGRYRGELTIQSVPCNILLKPQDPVEGPGIPARFHSKPATAQGQRATDGTYAVHSQGEGATAIEAIGRAAERAVPCLSHVLRDSPGFVHETLIFPAILTPASDA